MNLDRELGGKRKHYTLFEKLRDRKDPTLNLRRTIMHGSVRNFTALAAQTAKSFRPIPEKISSIFLTASQTGEAFAKDVTELCKQHFRASCETLGNWILVNAAKVDVQPIQDQQSETIQYSFGVAPHDECFGTFLGTYGPKHLYSASVKDLSKLDVWENQRTFCEERARSLALAKRECLDTVGFPGPITIVTKHDGTSAVCVDGQHRLAALQQLVEDGVIHEDEPTIIEVFSAHEGADLTHRNALASAVFTDINSCEPVKLCDIPGMLEAEEKAIIDDACMALKLKYPEMFKPTSRCRPPHVHLDSLREKLFEFNVIRKIKTDDAMDLERWLDSQNKEVLCHIKDGQWIAMRGRASEGALNKALAKANKYKFWIGMPGALGVMFDVGK